MVFSLLASGIMTPWFFAPWKKKNTVKPQFNKCPFNKVLGFTPHILPVPWPFIVRWFRQVWCSNSNRFLGKSSSHTVSPRVSVEHSPHYGVSFFCYVSFYCVTLQNKSFNYKFVLPCSIELFFHFLSQSHKCIFPGNIRIIDNIWNTCLIVLVESNRIYAGKACTYSLIRANKRNCFNIRMLTDESDSYKTFKILLTINYSPMFFKVMFNESKAQIQAPIFMTKP